MGSQDHRENQTTIRKPRFQDQWITKAIQKTTQNNNKKHDFRINGSGSQSLILKYCFCVFVFVLFFRWLWIYIDHEILVVLFLLVVSMVLAIHWSWNLGFLVVVCFLYGFCHPFIEPGILVFFVCLVFSMAFGYPLILAGYRLQAESVVRHSESTHTFKTTYIYIYTYTYGLRETVVCKRVVSRK